jgi:hypothetical protein
LLKKNILNIILKLDGPSMILKKFILLQSKA